jgi:hypothetical protein
MSIRGLLLQLVSTLKIASNTKRASSSSRESLQVLLLFVDVLLKLGGIFSYCCGL